MRQVFTLTYCTLFTRAPIAQSKEATKCVWNVNKIEYGVQTIIILFRYGCTAEGKDVCEREKERGWVLLMNSRQWLMEALPRVQALSTAVGTWEHASLPCPVRCLFGWAPFRMGALFSRIHGRVLGERLQAVAAPGKHGWNLNKGHKGGGETKGSYIPSFPPY